jgi:hypothetical protein
VSSRRASPQSFSGGIAGRIHSLTHVAMAQRTSRSSGMPSCFATSTPRRRAAALTAERSVVNRTLRNSVENGVRSMNTGTAEARIDVFMIVVG